jgi:hypothetical protein
LSPVEADLYQAVTTYVREEMNRADRSGDDKRRSNVGFALQILQRRLALHRRPSIDRSNDAGNGSKNGCERKNSCGRPVLRR